MVINAYCNGQLAYTGYLYLAARRFGFNEERAEYYLRTHNEGFNFKSKDKDTGAEWVYYICERGW